MNTFIEALVVSSVLGVGVASPVAGVAGVTGVTGVGVAGPLFSDSSGFAVVSSSLLLVLLSRAPANSPVTTHNTVTTRPACY